MTTKRALMMVLVFWMVLGDTAGAQTRELHWQSLQVSADLDADGALHVRETQAMVFNGDWNGGERRFNIRPGQKLKFERLVEKDALGSTLRVLQRGDLQQIGQFRWFDHDVLRWRSRLPTDPPFRDALRIYQLDYVISGVLVREGQQYILNHDFAFPDRVGIIEHFRGDLTLDPSWRAQGAFESTFDVDELRPGHGVVRRVVLDYMGSGNPHVRRVATVVSGWIANLVLAVLVVFAIAAAVIVIRRERERGRFEPLDSPDVIDTAWLEEHLLRYRPEVVGAAWDGEISTQEVMAILARLALAGQITSEVKPRGSWLFKTDVLHMQLHVDAGTLPQPERNLVRKLFFDGDTTDTDRISEHYRSRGFDPAASIRRLVQSRAQSIVGRDQPRPAWRWKVSAGLIAAGVIATAFGAWLWPETAPVAVTVACSIVGLGVIALPFARGYRTAPIPRAWLVFVVLFLVIAGLLGLRWALHEFRIATVECIGFMLLALGMLHVLQTALLCRRAPDSLRRHRQLVAARDYLQRELQAPQPRLNDAWLPYLLAFGLGPNVDRWFKAHASAVASAGSSGFPGTSTGSSSPSVTSTGWTGGGGAFGGAGASASWVSAVSTLAAGVSAPSSSGNSGGGGGGGGGGGSSGGGGGGGW